MRWAIGMTLAALAVGVTAAWADPWGDDYSRDRSRELWRRQREAEQYQTRRDQDYLAEQRLRREAWLDARERDRGWRPDDSAYGHRDHGHYGYETRGYRGDYVPSRPRYDYPPERDPYYAPGPAVARPASVSVLFGSDKERNAQHQVPGEIIDVQVQQMSKAPCVAGQTYGFSGNTLWATGGCRGNFTVTYQPGY